MSAWDALRERVAELETLDGIGGLLGWDQNTYLPPHGAGPRGDQAALISRLSHERLIDPRVGEWLDEVAAMPDAPGETFGGRPLDEVRRASVRVLRRRRDREVRVPADLVGALSRAQAAGFAAWLTAKRSSDFSVFAPALGEIVHLVRERAAAIDGDRPVYDVLVDEFDPGVQTSWLDDVFTRLIAGSLPILDAATARPQAPKLDRPIPAVVQREIHDEVLAALGFPADRARLDASEHPFTVGLHPDDVRITTRLRENDLLGGLGGTIHEFGHALYELGLPVALRGTGLCTSASIGLHESQSRLWENLVGRSRPFCGWLAGRLAARLGADAPDADTLLAASRRVERGLVRVVADEVTYNLHIAIRFRLESALVRGDLPIADLPGAWDDAYEAALGIRPPDAARGVLQDVHWSSGMIGYFPGYTLGNLYAVALWGALRRDHPAVDDEIAAGEFGSIRAWLGSKVHAAGATRDAADIVRDAVGEVDLVAGLLASLRERYTSVGG